MNVQKNNRIDQTDALLAEILERLEKLSQEDRRVILRAIIGLQERPSH